MRTNPQPQCVLFGEWPDAYGNYAPMHEHNRKRWILLPEDEIAVWRQWYERYGTDAWLDEES